MGDNCEVLPKVDEDQKDKKIRELTQKIAVVMSELLELKGQVSICGWCQKVRDKNGVWHNLVAFLARKAGLDFTHGICPDCMEETAGKG